MHTRPIMIGRQRLCGHRWPKIRATDADIHHISEPPSPRCADLTRAQTRGEIPHPGKCVADTGHDIFTTHAHIGIGSRTQCCMQYRAVFGNVDLVPLEHLIAPGRHARPVRKGQQQVHCLIIQPRFRPVEIQAGGLRTIPLSPIGIRVKQVRQRSVG